MSKEDQYLQSLLERLSEEKTSVEIDDLIKQTDFFEDFKLLLKQYHYSIKEALILILFNLK